MVPLGAVTVMTAMPAFIGTSFPSKVTPQTAAFEVVKAGVPTPSQLYGIACSFATLASIDFTGQLNAASDSPAIAALSAAAAASTSAWVASASASTAIPAATASSSRLTVVSE